QERLLKERSPPSESVSEGWPCFPIQPGRDTAPLFPLVKILVSTHENTNIWLFTHVQYIAVAIAFACAGATATKFRRPFWVNWGFTIYLVGACVVVLGMLGFMGVGESYEAYQAQTTLTTGADASGSQSILQTYAPPSNMLDYLAYMFAIRAGVPTSYRVLLFVLSILNITACVAWEWFVVGKWVRPWVQQREDTKRVMEEMARARGAGANPVTANPYVSAGPGVESMWRGTEVGRASEDRYVDVGGSVGGSRNSIASVGGGGGEGRWLLGGGGAERDLGSSLRKSWNRTSFGTATSSAATHLFNSIGHSIWGASGGIGNGAGGHGVGVGGSGFVELTKSSFVNGKGVSPADDEDMVDDDRDESGLGSGPTSSTNVRASGKMRRRNYNVLSEASNIQRIMNTSDPSGGTSPAAIAPPNATIDGSFPSSIPNLSPHPHLASFYPSPPLRSNTLSTTAPPTRLGHRIEIGGTTPGNASPSLIARANESQYEMEAFDSDDDDEEEEYWDGDADGDVDEGDDEYFEDEGDEGDSEYEEGQW
ncbi:hypothetical protein HK102_009348, partial [Quaeritorhiza haematococci]